LNSTLKSLLFWMVLIVVGVMIWQFSNSLQRAESPMAFSTFLEAVDKEQVQSVTITGNEITGTLNTSMGDGGTKFRTYAPSQIYEGLGNRLQDKKVQITAKPETTSPWATLLYSWAPILLMIGFWLFIMRQMQSGGNKALSFGKSRAKLSFSEKSHLQRCFRRRRGQGRAPGNHRVPEGTAEVSEARRPHPEGRAVDGLARDRKDAARARRRRRGQRSVLLDQRLRFRRDVRRRRRLTGT
jgi:hypothetical protein